MLVFYGLGVTIGAGIYVLIGATVSKAGTFAPLSFLMAALVMGPTALSYAELVCRMPLSAGEAAYVRSGLKSESLSVTVGLMVCLVGIVSASAITQGAAGYVREFVDIPREMLVPMLVLAMGGIALWGITESVSLAVVFTIVEIGGLLVIVGAGVAGAPDMVMRLPELVPPTGDMIAWGGVMAAGLLAFFAFVGFEDLVNIAEEVKSPKRTFPMAIILTLVISTVIYFSVVAVVVLAVPLDRMVAAEAPLSFVFTYLTGASPLIISAIAIVATLNGVIVQIVMGARILYGLADRGSLPHRLARVSGITRTPVLATALVTGVILVLAMNFPMTGLAEMTSRITLVVFVMVNLALIAIKRSNGAPPEDIFTVPFWVPVSGVLVCAGLLATDFLG